MSLPELKAKRLRVERRRVEQYIGKLPPLSKAVSTRVRPWKSATTKLLPGQPVLVHGLEGMEENGKRGLILDRTTVFSGMGLYIAYEVKMYGTGKTYTLKGANLRGEGNRQPTPAEAEEIRRSSISSVSSRALSAASSRPSTGKKRNAMEQYALKTYGVKPGRPVYIFGLKDSPQLNGLKGTVIRALKKINPTGKEVVGYDVRMSGGLFSPGDVERLMAANIEPA
jgi:hypothetical protein